MSLTKRQEKHLNTEFNKKFEEVRFAGVKSRCNRNSGSYPKYV